MSCLGTLDVIPRRTVPNPQLLTKLVNRDLLPIEARDFSSPLSLESARDTHGTGSRARGHTVTFSARLLRELHYGVWVVDCASRPAYNLFIIMAPRERR